MTTRPLVCVDLSDFESRKAEIATALRSAAEQEGFFYVTGHGIPEADVAAMYALAREFFAQPEEVKAATRGNTANPHYVLGYFSEELDSGPIRQGLLCGALRKRRCERAA